MTAPGLIGNNSRSGKIMAYPVIKATFPDHKGLAVIRWPVEISGNYL
jgi:hypothetical protein